MRFLREGYPHGCLRKFDRRLICRDKTPRRLVPRQFGPQLRRERQPFGQAILRIRWVELNQHVPFLDHTATIHQDLRDNAIRVAGDV